MERRAVKGQKGWSWLKLQRQPFRYILFVCLTWLVTYKDVITSTWILDIIIKIVFLRKSPSFGIQQRRNWDDGAANPNDEKENPCACFGHPRFQGSNNGNVPVNEKCSFLSNLFCKIVYFWSEPIWQIEMSIFAKCFCIHETHFEERLY